MSRRMGVHVTKLCLLILVSTVAYNEFLCYWLHYQSWPRLPTHQPAYSEEAGEFTTLLLVADPQILGLEHEPSGMLGAVRRWDGDRYLHKAYRWAQAAYKPPIVVFLGDLMDEASEADPDQMDSYAERFHSIYSPGESEMIYLPGDNDIGGEGADPVTLTKINQFETHFGPSKPVYAVKDWLDIVPVSRLTEHGTYNLSQKVEFLSPKRVTLVVSHLPVLPLNGRFAEKVLDRLNPAVIFSAHDHHGYLFTGDRQTGRLERDIEQFDSRNLNAPFSLQSRSRDDGQASLSDRVWEVVVPTCSYRMGVQQMGLGVARLNQQGDVFYANLWLPSRFSLLYSYAASAAIVCIILLVKKLTEVKRESRAIILKAIVTASLLSILANQAFSARSVAFRKRN